MLLTRRLWCKSVAAWSQCVAVPAATLDIARLLEFPPETDTADVHTHVRGRRYVARATVTLFGVPVFSRSGLGEGYVHFEDSPAPQGRSVGIEFGAGSFPNKAHGLNKLGLIRESVLETPSGDLAECAYFGFMTTSQETSIEDGKKSLVAAGETLTYSVGYGAISSAGTDGRTLRLKLPSQYDWRDRATIAREVRRGLGSRMPGSRTPLESGDGIPATFLYSLRKAMLDPERLTEQSLIFNGKYFVLRTEKLSDVKVGAELVRANVARSADQVVLLSGALQAKHGANRSTFRAWFENGSEQFPPLRFDYQAKPFLRLAFECQPLEHHKENS